jgi:uncharacterized protein (DUF2342 family)
MGEPAFSIDYEALARALMRQGLPSALAAELKPHVAAANQTAPPVELLTRDELAHALRVSPQTIDRRVREGMPTEYVGDLPRFDLAACRAWLAANAKPGRRSKDGDSDDGLLRSIRPLSGKKR